MDLLLSLESNNSVAWCGMSDTTIGTLKPGASVDIPLCLITLDTGIIVSNLFTEKYIVGILTLNNVILQTVSGLKLTDTFLKRVYEYDDLAQIFVNQLD